MHFARHKKRSFAPQGRALKFGKSPKKAPFVPCFSLEIKEMRGLGVSFRVL
jgi:hypothetical protein